MAGKYIIIKNNYIILFQIKNSLSPLNMETLFGELLYISLKNYLLNRKPFEQYGSSLYSSILV